MNRLWRWFTGADEQDVITATFERIGDGIGHFHSEVKRLEEDDSESFFTIAALRKQLAETETDRLQWKREAEVARLHLAGERRSNAALRGQITKLKGR